MRNMSERVLFIQLTWIEWRCTIKLVSKKRKVDQKSLEKKAYSFFRLRTFDINTDV